MLGKTEHEERKAVISEQSETRGIAEKGQISQGESQGLQNPWYSSSFLWRGINLSFQREPSPVFNLPTCVVLMAKARSGAGLALLSRRNDRRILPGCAP